ncbi:hypothetical protein JYU07_00150, partial [Roseiflexus sp. AH-315-K22]|nr:hypothetical protein [Roseiflexus sp. AH-315-K22]
MNGRAGDAQGDINRPADPHANPDEAVSLYALPGHLAQSLTIYIEDYPAPTHDTTHDTAHDTAHDAASDAASDDAWDHLCAQNPRLFDGPILALTRLDLDEGALWCVRDSYRRLALRDVCQDDVTILSVTVVLEASDERGCPHLLLGKRGLRTRSYPGLWELGPAGGLDVPPVGVATLDHTDLLAQANAELREEVGIREPIRTARAIALV